MSGLVSGACFADFGHDVVCVDPTQPRSQALKAGRMPIYEPGLDALVADNVAAGRLAFTTDLRRRQRCRRRASSPSARRRGAATAMPT